MACDLTTIIGLSRSTCNCFEDTPPDYDTSLSGYYIDETEGMNLGMASASEDCENGGIWDILTRARDNAIKDLKADLLVQMGAGYKRNIETASYTIGSQKHEGPYNPGTTYAGVRLVPRSLQNGVIILNSVKLLFNTTGIIQCRIFNNISSTPIHSFVVNAVANQPSPSAALNYNLPMYIQGESYVEYYIVYELPVSGLPNQNKIVCSSCLKWDIVCCDSPCFASRIQRDQLWNNNIMIGGIAGNTWEDLDAQTGVSNKNNGIILNLSTNCDYEELICQNLDFGSGNLPTANGMAIAKAAQLKASAYVISTLLSSGNVSRLNLSNREEVGYLRARYIKEYNDRISWLSQHLDIAQNGCFVCEERIIKGGIMV